MTRTLLLLGVVGLASLPGLVFADAGDADPTFGTGGIVTTGFGTGGAIASAVAVQADGKIVVAGYRTSGRYPSDARVAAVVRYLPDGTLDPDFGDQGRVLTDFGNYQDSLAAVALQPDGKIVAGGSAGGDMAVVRYLPDGALDTTFNGCGHVEVDFGHGIDWVADLVVQPDGKILAVGLARTLAGGYDFGLARVNPDGSPDETFGVTGRVTTAFGAGLDAAEGVVLQPDGRIVVAGRATIVDSGGSRGDFAVARYLASGELDSSFGAEGTGRVLSDLGRQWDVAWDVALQPDGRIVVAGQSGHGTTRWEASDFAVARYWPDGTLDTTFGGSGFAQFDLGVLDFGYELAVQADGRILVAGWTAPGWQADTTTNIEEASDFALLRVNLDGSADESFGAGGWVTTGEGSTWEHAFGLALQDDGRILAVGPTATGGPWWRAESTCVLVARYEGLGDPVDEVDGLGDGVRALAEAGALNQGQRRSLLAKLDVALAMLGAGNDAGAVNLLRAFVSQLEDLVATGELAPVEAQPLVGWAGVLIAALEGP